MAHVGIGRKSILAGLCRMVGHVPTLQQLSPVIGIDQLEVAGSKTEELITHVASQGGSYKIFEIPTDERGTVLIIMPLEYENLERFGDIVFLNGAMVRNALEWTTFPIPLTNKSCQIVSGGLLFTDFETESIFDWILRSFEY
jgi:hypothetical protein